MIHSSHPHAPDWLLAFQKNIQSKDGEDGILEKIFEIIGEESRWCVEMGALTGGYGSNVWYLLKERGWQGVLIEADPTYFEELQREYAGDAKATCLNEFVSFEGKSTLDAILSGTSIPKGFDLLSLDIDGNDYHVWESLTQYRPRVLVVEFNPSIPNNVSFVQPRDMSISQGSSLRALVALGKQKGYELVGANKDNAFFVLAELFDKFAMSNDQLDAVHTDQSLVTYLFQLYDGTIKIAGNQSLIWHQSPISEKKLQMLSARKRFFPNRTSSRSWVRKLKFLARKNPLYPFVQRIRKLV